MTEDSKQHAKQHSAPPLTLAVTSSTGIMSLAVGRDPRDAIEVELATDRRHAEELSPRLAEVLAAAGVTLRDLDRLAIDVGPGRFTGLRVGLATVRALAFALHTPVVGLTSLAVLAAGSSSESGAVTAVIDARRSEVFQQVFVGGIPAGEPRVGPPEVLAADAKGLVLGDGADRYLEHYEREGLSHAANRSPSAVTMIALCGEQPGAPGTDIAPLYLRDPDAKPNIKTRPTTAKGLAR